MLCGRQVLFLCSFTHKAFDFGFCFVKSFACFEYFKHHLQQLHELEIGHFVHAVSFPALASLCRAVSRDGEKFLLFAINKNYCEESAAKFRGKKSGRNNFAKILGNFKTPGTVY